MNNLAPMKNCPGVQGNLNKMSVYIFLVLVLFIFFKGNYSFLSLCAPERRRYDCGFAITQACALYNMPQDRAWKSYEYGYADADLHPLYTI